MDEPSRGLRTRFASGIVWNAISQVASQGGTFLSQLILANLLGASVFGEYAFVVGTAQALTSVCTLAAGIAATKFIAQHRHDRPALAVQVLAFCYRLNRFTGLVGSLALPLVAVFGAQVAISELEQKWYFLVAAPMVVLGVVNSLQVAALAGLEDYRLSALVAVPLAVLQVVLLTVLGHAFGLTGAVAGMTAVLMARTWVTHVLLKRQLTRSGLDLAGADASVASGTVIQFILPSALAGLTNMPAMWFATKSLLERPNGFEEFALFNVAFTLRLALVILPATITTVGFSLLNAHLSHEQRTDYQRILLINVSLCAGVAGGGALLVGILAEPLLSLYGNSFIQATGVLHVLLLSLLAEAISWPMYQSLLSRGRVWLGLLVTQFPRDIIMVALGMWLAKEHGALGVAWAHALGWGVALMTCILLVFLLPSNQGMAAKEA